MDDNVSIRVVQLTDCHLLSNSNDKLIGVNTDQSFIEFLDKT
jgi:hypothetical protein